ncbi:MAG: DUF3786 domain-containing protein [Desulfobacter sp.]|nr:DUF3786 domain-containing protein [Desulfobacter sp.]WDP85843.1 MAG: DUF3786 domain-containing protein [Desulfobacter sp.]
MALSVVDLYAKVLPKTNCKDCGYPTCIAFAGMVVSEKLPLKNCPHIDPDILIPAQAELEEQYKQGKWLKKDMAQEALVLARKKAASMALEDVADRIGGILDPGNGPGPFKGQPHIILPYFNSRLCVSKEKVVKKSGDALSRNEQTFVYIHLAAGGSSSPTGKMKSFKEFPNTVSKMVSMNDRVETPLKQKFANQKRLLEKACLAIGGTDVKDRYDAADLAFQFRIFPKVYVTLLFWDKTQGFEPEAKLMFDQTILDHMDIEAIMFMSEHLTDLLTNKAR